MIPVLLRRDGAQFLLFAAFIGSITWRHKLLPPFAFWFINISEPGTRLDNIHETGQHMPNAPTVHCCWIWCSSLASRSRLLATSLFRNRSSVCTMDWQEFCTLPSFPIDSCICTLLLSIIEIYLLPVFFVACLHATTSPRSLSSSPLNVPGFPHRNKRRSLKRVQLTEKDNWLTWSAARAPGLRQCLKDWKSATSTTPRPVQKANKHQTHSILNLKALY